MSASETGVGVAMHARAIGIVPLHSHPESARAGPQPRNKPPPMTERVPLDVASLSHPGMVRSHNEDAAFVDGVAALAVLADGMGGYNAGEVASGIAVDVITRNMLPELSSRRDLTKVDSSSGLTHAALFLQQQIEAANKAIYDAAQARPECAGMGTTIVASVFRGNRVSIGHVGDSRCYRLRGEVLEQLTRDHSLLQEQIDSGMLTPERAKYSLNKNLVTRALGIDESTPVDIVEYRVETGDVYLLCSDGLTDMIDADVIGAILARSRNNLAAAAAELVDLANRSGGRDNISVVLVGIPPGFLPSTGWVQRWLAKKKLNRAMGKLVLFLADGTTLDIPLDHERVTVGRRSGNDVCLPYAAVSGAHAVFVTTATGVVIEDLGSTNGTTVNGTRTQQAGRCTTATGSTSGGSDSSILPTPTRWFRRLAARKSAGRRAGDNRGGNDPEGELRRVDLTVPAPGYSGAERVEAVHRESRCRRSLIRRRRYRARCDDACRGGRVVAVAAGPQWFSRTPEIQRFVMANPPPRRTCPQPSNRSRQSPATPHGGPSLKVLTGPSAGRSLALTKDEALIGRVGRQVVAVRKAENDAFRLVVAEGAGVPRVNGVPVPPDGVLLQPDDAIEIAGAQLVFLTSPDEISS